MEVMVDPNFDMNDPVFKAEILAVMEKEWRKIGQPCDFSGLDGLSGY